MYTVTSGERSRIVMSETYDKINKWFSAMNDDLFNNMRGIVTSVEQAGNCIRIWLASICGVGLIEEEGKILISKEFFDQIQLLVADRAAYYFDNVNFGNFTKADLFKSINEKIAVPVQCNWNYQINMRYNNSRCIKKIAIESVPIFFTHIKHGVDHNNHLFIDEIRAEIPGSDELYLHDSWIKAFQNPQEFTLEEMTNVIWEIVQDANPEEDDFQLTNGIKSLPFSVNSPGSLLKMLSFFGIPEWGGTYF